MKPIIYHREIAALLREYFPNIPKNLNENDYDIPLTSRRMKMDEYDMAYLLMLVEDHFSCRINMQQVTSGNFNSINHVYDAISESLSIC